MLQIDSRPGRPEQEAPLLSATITQVDCFRICRLLNRYADAIAAEGKFEESQAVRALVNEVAAQRNKTAELDGSIPLVLSKSDSERVLAAFALYRRFAYEPGAEKMGRRSAEVEETETRLHFTPVAA